MTVCPESTIRLVSVYAGPLFGLNLNMKSPQSPGKVRVPDRLPSEKRRVLLMNARSEGPPRQNAATFAVLVNTHEHILWHFTQSSIIQMPRKIEE